jgi:hypothetical protein
MSKNFGFKPLEQYTKIGPKVIEYCKLKGYKIDDFNIIYFEGLDTDLKTANADLLDLWNDVRTVITGSGDVLGVWEATTEPGRYYTVNPLNPNGAARITLGQTLNAWKFGDHKGQDALVQCGDILVYRDKNKDGFRTGDQTFLGDSYGLNQHTTKFAPGTIGRWSAGCLVGRYESSHDIFMAMCRASGLKRFSAIVIDGSDFVKFLTSKVG